MTSNPEERGRRAAEAAIVAGNPKWAELIGVSNAEERMIDPETGLPIIRIAAAPSEVAEQQRFIAGHNAVITEALKSERITKTFARRLRSKSQLFGAVATDPVNEIGSRSLRGEHPRAALIHVPPKRRTQTQYRARIVIEYDDGETVDLLPYRQPTYGVLLDGGLTLALRTKFVVMAFDVETAACINRFVVE